MTPFFISSPKALEDNDANNPDMIDEMAAERDRGGQAGRGPSGPACAASSTDNPNGS